jgi:lysophospholipase L1-like esterase
MMHDIEKLASNSTAGSIWDPFPILCPPAETQCPAYNDNKPLYFDGDHLSGYANQVLRESLEAALVNAGKTR